MIYRAKCRKCETIIETEGEEVFCKCGEISIGGHGNPSRCSANNFSNFVRVDEEGREIEVVVEEKKKLSKDELLNLLKDMIRSIEQLPQNAKVVAVNQFDMLSLLYLLDSLFSCDDS